MTAQDAIDSFKTIVKIGFFGVDRTEAVKLAIEALEKQIPKKPYGTHYAHMKCPACNHRIPSGMGSSSRRRDNWCNYCGQAIDWRGKDGT